MPVKTQESKYLGPICWGEKKISSAVRPGHMEQNTFQTQSIAFQIRLSLEKKMNKNYLETGKKW